MFIRYEMDELRFIGKMIFCSYCSDKFIAVSLLKPLFIWFDKNNLNNEHSFYDKTFKFKELTHFTGEAKKFLKAKRIFKARKLLAQQSYSSIKQLLCYKNKPILIFSNENKNKNGVKKIDYHIRYYKFKGENLVPIKETVFFKTNENTHLYSFFSFDKDHLYMLEIYLSNSFDEKIRIHKFKITD